MDLKALIRDVPDFPSPGIVFKDITPLLQDPSAVRSAVSMLADRYRSGGVDTVVGIESRGFILGAPAAQRLRVPFVPIRKAGKLPAATIARSYDLEYGSATIEMHADAIGAGQRVALVDDLLATGGTAEAAVQLIAQSGAEIGMIAVLIELAELQGRNRLLPHPFESLLTY